MKIKDTGQTDLMGSVDEIQLFARDYSYSGPVVETYVSYCLCIAAQ